MTITTQSSSIEPSFPEGEYREGEIIDQVASRILTSETPLWWWLGFAISGTLALIFLVTLGAIALVGTGLWGINIPVVWGVGIVNLVFWIGIGHAGTFISAFLLLMRQHWRGAFSRFAEAMTLFALLTAGVFPLIHVGRPEFIYYIIPYPNTMGLNSQWRSALVWDFIAITAYGLVSLIFWYIDLIPDLAAMRDRAENPTTKRIYGLFAMGWRNESTQWRRLQKVTYLLAVIATPLVISVHSVVGFDFAIGNLAGWHHTIFPPYFVAGAVFSGFAMVTLGAIGLRAGLGLSNIITKDHLENAAKFMLVTGTLVGYGYGIEIFAAWFNGDPNEVLVVAERMTGPYAPLYWGMVFFNVILIQLFWFKQVRRSIPALIAICLGILVGMWLERFVIISISLTYVYMAPMWELFYPTIFDVLTVLGAFGLFLTPFFLFIRFVPVVPMYEMEELAAHHAHQHHDHEEDEA
jgi:molybdopterin-containing oxidoreductase family membrane subunit